MELHKLWLLKLIIGVGFSLTAIGMFNFIVDPYDFYRAVKIAGFNANKYVTSKHSAMYKSYWIQRSRPRVVALGSSRTEIGIDPLHPGWDRQWGDVYNLGVSGAGIDTIFHNFKKAHELAPLKQVVLGLDFFSFNAYRIQKTGGDEEGAFERLVSTLFTVNALGASIETLRKQDAKKYPGYLENGQMEKTFDLKRVRKKGHRKGFLRTERKYLENNYLPPPHRKYSFFNPETDLDSFEYFEKLLRIAREDNVDLRLYISPMHARLCEVVSEADLWPMFEDWKRRLVATLAEDAAAHPGEEPFVLWDFSGYSTVTTEAVPPLGEAGTLMLHYWEASHFRSETGDLVLDRIFAFRDPERKGPEDFGVAIDVGNIEAHLKRSRSQQAEYRKNHHKDIEEIRAIRESVSFLN